MKFSDFLNHLSNYEPGKDIEAIAKECGVKEVIKLASNEDPSGAPPKMVRVLQENAFKTNLYPDGSMVELEGELAQKYNIKNENITIGAGSSQVIEFAIRPKLNPQNTFLQAGVSFTMYEIYARQCGARCYKTQSIIHDLFEFRTLYEAHKDEVKVIFLCLPNNPLGECLDTNEVFEFIRDIDEDCLVIIDATYNEFANFEDQNKYLKPCDLVQEFKGVSYLGTFSKFYGLDGLRIGCGIADAEIISAFYKLRAPFGTNDLALRIAVAALHDEESAKKTLESNSSQMELYKEFAKKHHIKLIGNYTNFITYSFEEKSNTDLSEKLLKKGIIVRDLKSYDLNTMRTAIGTPYESERLFTEFKGILK